MKNYKLTVYNTCTGKYEDVEVTKEVYEGYRRTKWNLEDDDKRFHEHQIPFSCVIGSEGIDNFHEVIELSKAVYEEDQSDDREEYERKCLIKALKSLDKADLFIIKAIFCEGKHEADIAAELHIDQSNVNRRKKKILKKLSTFFRI